MVWTGQTFSVGQILTAAQMTNLQADITALANGDSGAPSIVYGAMSFSNNIVQGDLGANCVGQSEVKTTYQQVESLDSEFTATGGVYCIGHTMNGTTVGNYLTREYTSANSSSYLARWRWVSGGTANDRVRLYYINSSPPYDLGDGEIPMFVYAIINNATGEIETTSISPDPIWAYNGPTDITPSRYAKDGKVYRSRRDMSAMPFTFEQAKLDPGKLKEYIAAFNVAGIIEEEITQAMKNADMDVVPHPFQGNDLTGKTVVMLDPVSPIMEDLLTIQQHDNGDMSDIVHNYLTIGNTQLDRVGPAGLLIPSVKWKNTL